MEFILGTATFGSTYGVANNGKQLSESNALNILEKAFQWGVEVVDTSPDYANAESIIGAFHQTDKKFRVHSKIPGKVAFNSGSILRSLESSLRRLRVDKLEVAYFHNPDSLFKYSVHEVNKVIEDIAESGMVKSLGASVYTEEEISRISREYPTIRVFQVPENILDQRLRESQIVGDLKEAGCKFFVRSIFLQGLLLMNPEKLPTNLLSMRDGLNGFHEIASSMKLSPLKASLGYLLELHWASGFLIGISDVNQLAEVLLATDELPRVKLPERITTELIDPRNWNPA